MSTTTVLRAAAPARRRPARRPAKRKGRRDNWWPLVVVALVALLGVAWARVDGQVPEGTTCAVDGGTVTLTAEQATNATTIAQVGRDRGLPDRAIVIALATAQQESGLRNLDYGDRDSLGLFQQRPSQGWGTPAQVQDPVYAAGIFYDRLVQVPGWDSGELTLVADAVQRSAFPLAYGKWSGMAEELTAALKSGTLNCE
jgi:hypothetical protein